MKSDITVCDPATVPPLRRGNTPGGYTSLFRAGAEPAPGTRVITFKRREGIMAPTATETKMVEKTKFYTVEEVADIVGLDETISVAIVGTLGKFVVSKGLCCLSEYCLQDFGAKGRVLGQEQGCYACYVGSGHRGTAHGGIAAADLGGRDVLPRGRQVGFYYFGIGGRPLS